MSGLKVIALVFLLAGATAACIDVRIQGGSPVPVNQFSSRALRVGVTNYCDDANVTLTVDSEFPAVVEPDSMFLKWGETRYVYLTVSPMNAEGLHEVVLRASNGEETVRDSVAVKVLEDKAPLFLSAPTSVSFREGEAPVIWVNFKNNGNIILNNIVLFAEEDGEKHFHGSFLTLQPESEKSIRFELGELDTGIHTLKVKAVTGEYASGKYISVKINPESVPISTVMDIRESSDQTAYVIDYKITNMGEELLNNLFLTVEDAPIGWAVISPPEFDLAPGESTEVEIILEHDEVLESNVTIGVYSNNALILEEALEIRLDRIRGLTGLFLLGGDSIGWGLLILLVIGIVYLFYTHFKNRKQAPIKEITALPAEEAPKGIRSWWPFG